MRADLDMYARPLLAGFPDTAALVGLCDHNRMRLVAANQILGTDLPLFTDVGEALAALDPDGVIVCIQDHTHAEFIVKALDTGKRVYCEKPLCTTAGQCRQIVAAAARSAGDVFVTHNMRYPPTEQKLKELVAGGKIGRPLSLEFTESLDRSHGANFFRHWRAPVLQPQRRPAG